jgi:CheY-like chemotaxis protein
MAPLPRILTVDPTGDVARIVRAAIDLMDRTVIETDVPGGQEALEELKRGGYNLVATALELDAHMKGFELALRVKQAAPDTAVIIMADVSEPEDLDDETRADSPFVYLHRPVDVEQFIRVLTAGLEGKNILEASVPPVVPAASPADMGPVPVIDLTLARRTIDQLLADLGAMAIILTSRAGEVLLEAGAVGYLNREQLTKALMPMVSTNIEMGTLVGGGQASALQFYDGDTYDVFVLSTGLHHFLCIVFDGQIGARQFGAVNRFGRRAAEDLIAILGASAFIIKPPTLVGEEVDRPSKRKAKPAAVKEEEEEVVLPTLVHAEQWGGEEPKVQEQEPLKLEPIADFDADDLFGSAPKVDEKAIDDLFNPDKLAEIANQPRRGGPISYDEAKQLGIVP